MTNTSIVHRWQRRRSPALLASALAPTVIATMLQPVFAIAAPAQAVTPAASSIVCGCTCCRSHLFLSQTRSSAKD